MGVVFEKESPRLILWVPALFAIGALLYYALPDEPHPLSVAALGAIAFLLRVVWRRARVWWLPTLALSIIALGFGYALIHGQFTQTPMLEKPMDFATVEGRIAELEAVPGGVRVTLDRLTIPNLQTPLEKVRLKLRGEHDDLLSGQRIRLRGGLMPASGPAAPGGFDFARWFYFKGIGAVGYGIPPVEQLGEDGQGSVSWLTQMREWLTRRIRAQLPEAEGAVAAALMTGDRAAIPEHVNDVMRDASLSHILAISGMHMAIITGLVFFALRYLLVLLPWTRHSLRNKKHAALGALAFGLGYLLIAGLPVSALRAFIMVALVFGAVIADRRVMPMRSLALAALLLLLYHPAYILEPGFQLSFVATAALIAWYERLVVWSEADVARPRQRRILAWIIGIATTSFVAQAATTPFVLYHFNNLPVYGLLANLLVMPIVSFAMMPLVVLSFLLLPVGLEGLTLQPLGWCIRAMIQIAEWIALLPYHRLLLPAPPDWGMALMAFGLAWLIVWQTRLRYCGALIILLGLASYATLQLPDIFISNDAKQVALRNANGYAMIQGNGRGFIAEQWAESVGQERFAKAPDLRCDPEGCAMAYAESYVALPRYAMAVPEDCRQASLVISPSYVDGRCDAQVIDREQLPAGHHWGWWENGQWRFETTHDMQGNRLWTP